MSGSLHNLHEARGELAEIVVFRIGMRGELYSTTYPIDTYKLLMAQNDKPEEALH